MDPKVHAASDSAQEPHYNDVSELDEECETGDGDDGFGPNVHVRDLKGGWGLTSQKGGIPGTSSLRGSLRLSFCSV